MQTAQKPPVPFRRLLVVAFAGIALIAVLGVLAFNDTFEFPGIGNNETTNTQTDASVWHPPADRGPAGALQLDAGDVAVSQMTTLPGHRHQAYSAESNEPNSVAARPAEVLSIAGEPTDHRYLFNETEPVANAAGIEPSRTTVRPDSVLSIAGEPTNHRYLFNEIEPGDDGSENYPESHRIGRFN